MMVRWYTPAEALKMATADNGELMALSGFINPYPGKLGVVEEGALADLLLVDGNPLENIKLVADPEQKLSGDYEGRHDLQEYTVQVTSWGRGAECISSMGERYWSAMRRGSWRGIIENEVRLGSIASVLRCPHYVRFAGNFRNAGLLLRALP